MKGEKWRVKGEGWRVRGEGWIRSYFYTLGSSAVIFPLSFLPFVLLSFCQFIHFALLNQESARNSSLVLRRSYILFLGSCLLNSETWDVKGEKWRVRGEGWGVDSFLLLYSRLFSCNFSLVFSSFRPFLFSSFCPFVLLSFCPFVLSSFCQFIHFATSSFPHCTSLFFAPSLLWQLSNLKIHRG